MRIFFKDYKKNIVQAKTESQDDLWYLSYVVEANDILKAQTFRKIKLGGEEDRDAKVIKKPATISIKVEKVEFSKFTLILRVSGTITEAPEDIPLGSHHTLSIETDTEFTLQKPKFLKYQIDRLEEASRETKDKILICVHDREEAYFAVLKKYGYVLLSHIKGTVQKKTDMKAESSDFFSQLKEAIVLYDKQHAFSHILIASPGFWRDYVQKLIVEPELKKKVSYATCSSAGENGINEVIRRPEVKEVLKEEKFAKEVEKVEELLTEIARKGKAEYGLDHVLSAQEAGAVSELLVTDSTIEKMRQEGTFLKLEKLMREVDQANGEIHIISAEHEGGRKLAGLGGVAAILRYKMSYE
ncbi:MAG: mRNA surveillance protein pelota [Nanoarchaeota archaeon]|nr:mRNA surveillance protein pelota [Nanoarchaeota archaeon]